MLTRNKFCNKQKECRQMLENQLRFKTETVVPTAQMSLSQSGNQCCVVSKSFVFPSENQQCTSPNVPNVCFPTEQTKTVNSTKTLLF